MYDLGLLACSTTLPSMSWWSVVTTTLDPSGMLDCSLTLCRLSKSTFCFLLNWRLSFLNCVIYDQFGMSCFVVCRRGQLDVDHLTASTTLSSSAPSFPLAHCSGGNVDYSSHAGIHTPLQTQRILLRHTVAPEDFRNPMPGKDTFEHCNDSTGCGGRELVHFWVSREVIYSGLVWVRTS